MLKQLITSLILLVSMTIPLVCAAAAPTLSTPATSNVKARQATLSLTASGTGTITGYFTLLSGAGTACGTATQVKSGKDSKGNTAPSYGSLALTSGTAGNYTISNLTQNSTYTVCAMADNGAASPVVTTNLTTTGITARVTFNTYSEFKSQNSSTGDLIFFWSNTSKTNGTYDGVANRLALTGNVTNAVVNLGTTAKYFTAVLNDQARSAQANQCSTSPINFYTPKYLSGTDNDNDNDNVDVTVTCSIPDTTNPVLKGAAVNSDGTTLTMTFNEGVSSYSSEDLSAFTVLVNNVTVKVTKVEFNGSTAILTLATQVYKGQTVKMSYKGSSESIYDNAFNALPGFSNYTVTNNSTAMPSPLYFIGTTTTLKVNKNSAPVDITGLLHAAYAVAGKTFAWSQAVAPNNGGKLIFTGATANSGSADITPGGAITYQPAAGYSGTETFKVQVSDGTYTDTRTITVTFNSDNANLKTLVVKSGTTALTLSPTFAAATTTYSTAVASTVTSVTITPTVADTTAKIKVNGVAVNSGAASAAITLAVGANAIPVEITAEDGTVKTYTINVTRAAADGTGTVTVSPVEAVASSSGKTFTFVYTAAAGGMSGGEINISASALGTVGTAATTAGTVSYSGGTIKVTGLTLAEGATVTITWSNATVTGTIGSKSINVSQKSISGGTLKNLALLPKVTVIKAPTATTSAATGVSGTASTLNGTVVDNGAATTVSFEYGTTTAYGTTIAAGTNGTIAANAGSKGVNVNLTGLTCGGVTYNYRVKAENSVGITHGSNMTFKTGTVCPPVITTPTVNAASGLATFTFKSNTTGTGYFTLLKGNNATCGTSAMVKGGKDSTGKAPGAVGSLAAAFGTLPLTANTDASYTVRNLMEKTDFTVCFTADKNGTLADPLSASFTTSAMATYSSPGWSAVGTAGFSTASVNYPSFSFAPDGTPYMSYQDSGNSGKATVMKYNGTAWSVVGTAGFSAGSAYFTSLSFAQDGTPYLAYQDVGNSRKATVMKYNGTAWVAVGTVGFSSNEVAYTSLAFAPDGTPYLAYLDSGNSKKATVMKYNGTAWVAVGAVGFSVGNIGYISLSFAPDGSPYVVYTDYGNSGKATVMKYNGTAWSAVGNAGFTTGSASYNSLSFAHDGTPYLAYSDSSVINKATVMKYNGTAWSAVGNAGFSSGQATYNSLSFAPDGTPYLAYSDSDNKYKATLLKYDGTAWSAVGNAGFSSGQANYTSLSFAPDGTPYIAYREVSNSGKATVMRLQNTLAAPTVFTTDATALSTIGATLNGTISANGAATTASFEYGTTTAYGSTITATQSPLTATAANAPVSAVLTGLSCNTLYYFRANGVNSLLITKSGSNQTFTTSACPPGPPTATTGSATVASSGITLNGTVSASGAATTVTLEYGTTTAYGSSVAATQSPLASSATGSAVSASVTGLTCNTLYHFRVNATNSATTNGGDQTFTSQACPPAPSTPVVSTVAANLATISVQSTAAGTGYLTILLGHNATCGTGEQVRSGKDSSSAATRNGSLKLSANTAGNYTFRNLAASTQYTVCFTADAGGDAAAPVSANMTTSAMATYAGPGWVVVGTAGISAGYTMHNSLAFSKDGVPYVAYSEIGAGAKVSVKKFDGAAWSSLADISNAAGSSTRLSFAPDGTLYGAYKYSDSGDEKLAVKKHNGTAWDALSMSGISAFYSYETEDLQMAIAPDGAPWITYRELSQKGAVSVMRFDGSAWKMIGEAIKSTTQTSLAFAPDGTAFVAFADGRYSDKATVMKYNGSAWVDVGASAFSTGTPFRSKLFFAPDGTPYLGYGDTADNNKARVRKFDGVSWNIVGTAAFSPEYATETDAAITPDGIPYIVFNDSPKEGRSTVVHFTGTAWEMLGKAGFSEAGIYHPSFAIAPDGTPYIAFSDVYSGKTTVMRLDSLITPPSPTTGAATSLSETGATLSGTVTSNGLQSDVTFEYGATTAYGSSATATQSPLAAGASGSAVSAAITGLSCGTTYHFRVAASNSKGGVNGSDASFTTSACPAPPSISTHPANATVNSESNTSFTVTATGHGLTYQWQLNSGSGFSDISNAGVYSGATTATLSITGAANEMNGYIYRVVITGSVSPAATSNNATLTVNTPPSITTQPISARVQSTGTATFTVAATGAGTLSYQWQVSSDSGSTFTNIANSGVYSGATTSTLTVANPAIGMNSYKYRVIVTGSVSPVATSNSVTLTVSPVAFPILSDNWASPWSNITAGNDATKSGATLTLTTATGDQTGYIFFTQPFSATLGINATFDFYTGNGTGADGFSFFLIDGNASPSTPGKSGAALGYSTDNTNTGGLVGGWVGIGFDEYGGFSSTNAGTNGSPPGQDNDSVTIRGSASGGYKYITKGNPGFSIDGGDRKVNLTIDKNQKITVKISSDGGSNWSTPIPNVNLNQALPASGYFKLGFAGSTGGSHNIHRVSNVVVTIPIDNIITGSGLPANSGNGSTVSFNLQVCAQNTANLQTDSKAKVTVTPIGMTLAQSTFGPFDLASGCKDIPVTGTVTAASGGAYSYSATVSSDDAGFGDVNPSDNTATQSGTVLAAPTTTTGVASAISATGATLNATINANSVSTAVSFDYGTTTSYGTTTAATTGGTATGAGNTAASRAITGLTCNTTYHFRVKGVSNGGTKYGDDASFTTTACVPGAPAITSTTAGNAQVAVAFTAPASNGGSAITSYTVTSTPGNKTAAGATSPLTVTGLTNGVAYTFKVTATNSAGTGAASAASSSATPKGSQTIGAITFVPNTLTIGGTTMASATATSSLDVTFSSTTTGICTVNGKSVTAKAIGTCTIKADQEGDDTYSAATSVTNSITVGKATQTISFAEWAITKNYGEKDFGTGAKASSGLDVTYTSSNNAVAIITAEGLVSIKGAGTATITAAQAGDATHNSATAAMSLTINKAKLTVTAENKKRDYGAAEPTFTATYSGFVKGETASVITGAPSFTTTATSISSFGSYPITPSAGTLSAANYQFTFVDGALSIGLEPQTITFNRLPVKTYGDAAFSVSATAGASGAAITFSSSNTAVATVSGTTVTIVGAGETVITAGTEETATSTAGKAQQTLTVKKAPLMVTAVNAERRYGEPDPVFGVTYKGFVNGQDKTVLTGAPAITSTATSTSPTGSYPITPATGTLASNNYEFIFVKGTLALNLALQRINFAEIPVKTYGDANFSLTATGGASGNQLGIKSSDSSVAVVDGTTVYIKGIGKALITASQAGNDYYAEATESQLITVKPATLTVTADDKTRAFGAANPALTITYTGFKNSDTTAKLSGAPETSTTADTTSVSGSYPITVTAGNLSSDNYEFSYTNGTLSISKAVATAALSNTSQTYDATAKSATAVTNPSGLYVELTYTDSNNNPVTSPTTVGAYNITGTIVDQGYTGSTTGALTIAKANQTIKFPESTVTKTYGAADFGPGATTSSGLTVTYTSSNTNVATITNSGLVKIIGAGTAVITATQTGNDNYNQATAALTLTVEKAVITVTAKNAKRAAGAAEPEFSATYTGFVNGESATVITGAPTFTTNANITSPSGSYTITPATGTLAANNYIFTFANGTLAVGIGSQNIIFNPLTPKKYGEAPFEITATGGASGNPVTFTSSNAAVATVDGNTITIKGAGETTITATQEGNSNYAEGKATQTLKVKPASLILSAENKSRVYGEANPNFTVTYSGFVNSDDETTLTGTPAITTTANTTSPSGSYPITVEQGTLASTNYSFIFAQGILGVDLASQNIVFNPLMAMNYGDAAFNPGAIGDASGNPLTYQSSDPSVATVNGQTLTITGAGETIITAHQAGNANYAEATAKQTLTIKPATLTVTAENSDRLFGQANPAFTATYTGFANGDDTSKLTGKPEFATTAETTSPAGTYPISIAAGNLFSNNYIFSYQNGILTVGQAKPVITWGNPSAITYGTILGANQLNATADVPGAFSYTPAAGIAPLAGIDHTLTATFIPTDVNSYTETTAYANITVGKAAQTIIIGQIAATGVGETNTLTATGGGSGKAVTFATTTASICEISETTVTGKASGTCTITANQAGDDNYTAAATATTNISIGKSTAGITLSNLTQSYDGTAKAAVVTTTPFGLTVNITYDGSATTPVNTGSYPVIATIADENYQGATTGTLTITKANQTITFAGQTVTKTYGTPDFGPDATTSTGLPLTYSSDNTAVATITGNGLIRITGTGTATITAIQAGADNYNQTTATVALNVNKKTLTVTADNAKRAFGADNPAFSATYAGFVNGEDVTVISGAPTFSTTAEIGSPAGSYPITPEEGTLASGNYQFRFENGILAVGIASQNIIFNPLTPKTYGEASFDISATGGGSGNPVTFSSSNPAVATVTGSTVTIIGAGETTITASQTGNSNYAEATAKQTLTVKQAPLMVTASNASRFYGEDNPAFTVTYSGFVNSETAAVLTGTSAITTNATTTSNTGSYQITVSTGTLASNNYRFILSPGTLAVDVASQNITFSPIPSKTYGGTTFELSATGGASGNVITYTSSNPGVATVNGTTVTITGAGEAIIIAKQEGNVNYASATAQQLLTVNPATLTVTASNATRIYGAANPGFSVTYSGFVNNEDQSILKGAAVLAAVADATTPVGSYPITVAAGNLFSNNYVFNYINGSLTIGQATPVLTWNTPTAITFGTALNAAQLNATANVAGTFSYTPPVGTVLNVGTSQTLTLTFTPADTVNYTVATASTAIAVAKAGQTIAFGTAPAILVNGTGTVNAIGGASGNGVVFSSTTPGVCTVNGSTVTGIAAGVCAITADQAGNASFNAALQVTQSITVSKANQTITFGAAPAVVVGSTGTVSATATSGLAVIFASTTPAVCTLSGSTITGVTAGACTITATQAGDANYTPAAAVNQTLTVAYNSAPPTLVVSALSDGATTTETTQNISGKVTDVNGVKSVTVNNNVVQLNPDGSFSYPVQLLAGANTITVVAVNNAGVSTTDIRTLHMDSTAPKLTVSYPPDNAVAFQKSITVNGTIAELLGSGKATAKTVSLDPTLTVSYKVNGSAPQAASLTDTTYTFTTNLDDGMNTIQVSASNAEGKKVEAKRTVSYQLPIFSLSITDPAADIRTVQDSYLLTGKVTDNSTPVAISISMDGQSFTPQVQNGIFQQQLSLSKDQTYQISVSGTDQNNNSLTVQRNIIRSLPKTADGESAPFTIVDALLALQMAVGIVAPQNDQVLRLDVAPMLNGVSTGDGKIDIQDAVVILRMAVGLM